MSKSQGLIEALKAKPAAAIADELGITRQAISQWDEVPHNRVLAIERFTGVSRQVLRPDLYPMDGLEAANG
jgi:DNA-binding transcriptional regulator YdaS (Cro superfamily)